MSNVGRDLIATATFRVYSDLFRARWRRFIYIQNVTHTHIHRDFYTSSARKVIAAFMPPLSRALFSAGVFLSPRNVVGVKRWKYAHRMHESVFRKVAGFFFFVRRHAACTRFWTEDKLMRVLLLYICIRDTSSCVLLLVRRVVL